MHASLTKNLFVVMVLMDLNAFILANVFLIFINFIKKHAKYVKNKINANIARVLFLVLMGNAHKIVFKPKGFLKINA